MVPVLTFDIETVPDIGGLRRLHELDPSVSDEQVADMAQNAVQYQVLARGLNRHFAILSMAANDGKR